MKKSPDPIKELKRELAYLKKKIAKLEKQFASNEKRTNLTCTSLKILDSKGNPVVSINSKGELTCVSLGVGNGPSHNKPLKLGEKVGSPFVSLRAQGDQESVSISAAKGQGAVILLSDKDGDGCVSIGAAKNGTLVRINDSLLGKTGVMIRAHHGSAKTVGEITTYDRNENVTASMP